MTGSGCVVLYFSLFHSVCSLKEQFIISGIPGITHTCQERFFTSSFADTYRQCLQYCWMTTRCTACTWSPRSSVCRLHDREYSVQPQVSANTSCLFTEASSKHLSKHHPCQARPCDAAQTCAAVHVEAASSFICLPVPVAATTFATVSSTTAFDTADSTTTTPTTTTPTSTTAPATSTTAAAEVADAASTTTPTTAITTFAIATATTIVTTTAAAVTANSTTTTTTTSNTPTSTTPTTATSTTPTTTTLLISCSFEYMGCYLDDSNRMLKGFREESDVMTREWCLVKCREGNYTFAGLEHYRHCFCGDSYDKSVYTKKSECNTPCTGNRQQMCGGGWRLSVFICR